MGSARFVAWVCFLLLSLFVSPASAQQTTTLTSDPQAVSFATKALAALTGGKPITDVTLTGTAARTAGSDAETGTITLKALGPTSSRVEFAGSGGNRAEIRNSSPGFPQGAWVGTDGVSHAMAYHNCVTDAVWFFPALSILSEVSTANAVVRYVGQENRNGASVYHLRFLSVAPSFLGGLGSALPSLGNEEMYLDSSTLLPVVITFNAHPDDDGFTSIPMEVDFSQYKSVQGALVPFGILKLFNGSLLFDISVQSATINSGLSDSEFDIQ